MLFRILQRGRPVELQKQLYSSQFRPLCLSPTQINLLKIYPILLIFLPLYLSLFLQPLEFWHRVRAEFPYPSLLAALLLVPHTQNLVNPRLMQAAISRVRNQRRKSKIIPLEQARLRLLQWLSLLQWCQLHLLSIILSIV